MKKRIVYLDLARGLSVIWIVGILHVIGYIINPEILPPILLRVVEAITISCLATFTFLSGHFVASKPLSNWFEIKDFFSKRLKRFAILYFIACVSLYAAGIVLDNDVRWFKSVKQLLATMFGLSGLIPDYQPATFWYFSMIILFYLLTPLMLFAKTQLHRVIISLIIFCIILLETVITGADIRLPFYFLFYALGAFYRDERYYLTNKIPILALLFIAIALTINTEYYLSLQNIIAGIFGVVLILSVSYRIYNPKIISILSFIAYGSMCAYLYHRHIYAFIKKLYCGNYWPVYIWPIIVVAVFVIGYLIQLTYDRCMKAVESPKNISNT